MIIYDITNLIQNKYGNHKEYKQTFNFDSSEISFIEDCLTKEEKMENKLINKDIKQSKIYYKIIFFIGEGSENDYDINFRIVLLINNDDDIDIDIIYHFDWEKNITKNITEYLNEISYRIDYITNFVLNIKIDISEIKKIFIETFADRFEKSEIDNAIRLLEKYKYLDKNNAPDIINIIDGYRAYKNYIEYRNAIFKLITKDFKKCLVDLTGKEFELYVNKKNNNINEN